MHLLITGSSGLIGSEAVVFFDQLGFSVTGVDNNMRADFFGPQGDTNWNLRRVQSICRRFEHVPLDIRDRAGVKALLASRQFDAVIHCAAQPSHDLAGARPLDDFDVNAVGTLNLLEACRQHAFDAPFCHMSTNKVYGDGPNRIRIRELATRWDYDDAAYADGIPETFPIDHCLHSLLGASKSAADILVQEYGRYYGMKTGVFRGGCLTGPTHSGVELHGFLNYLVATALREGPYKIFGYKGKQVRDQIHSHDVVSCFWHFIQKPRSGEVYNLGGGRDNAASLLECVEKIAVASGGKRPKLSYVDQPRVGDHICYYSDLSKLRNHYPDFQLTYTLDAIIEEMVHTVTALHRG